MAEKERLQRRIGVPGATALGLGSMVGTGVFVSMGLAAPGTGSYFLVALAIAGFIALCNGLSSAYLASHMPISGGTYSYAYHSLGKGPALTSGWSFLTAKSASAATALLGFGAYITTLFPTSPWVSPLISALTLVILTLVVFSGTRLSARLTMVLVGFSIAILLVTSIAFLASTPAPKGQSTSPGSQPLELIPFVSSVALLFVAFTGYGRVATLGEEIKNPSRSIPRAVVSVVFATALIYGLVGGSALSLTGPEGFGILAQGGAPLEALAQEYGLQPLPGLLAVAAGSALLSVVMNLLLGLSRVILAMARNGHLPQVFARLNKKKNNAPIAVIASSLIVGALLLIGDIRLSWSISATAVLLYYGHANASALATQWREEHRLRWYSLLGFILCTAGFALVDPVITLSWVGVSAIIYLGAALYPGHNPGPVPFEEK